MLFLISFICFFLRKGIRRHALTTPLYAKISYKEKIKLAP